MNRYCSLLLCTSLVTACGQGNGTAAAADDATPEVLSFSVDGKTLGIPAEDVSTRVQDDGTFKIFAGEYGELGLVLTVPNIAACPCTVPAGSPDADSPINQGSISLQNYPNAGNGLNNWYVGEPGVPAPDAIRVTDVGSVRDGVRIISGTFATRLLRTESNGDGPENRDTDIVDGRFRVAHEVHGGNQF
jgi:hypothetical protein